MKIHITQKKKKKRIVGLCTYASISHLSHSTKQASHTETHFRMKNHSIWIIEKEN